MSTVSVVTDTTQYLPREVIERHGLHLVSLYVNWDGRVDREIDLPDYDAYYDFLQARAASCRARRSRRVGDFLAVYEPLVAARRRHPLDPPLGRDLRHGARRRAGARAADRARDGARADGRGRLAAPAAPATASCPSPPPTRSSGGADLAGAVGGRAGDAREPEDHHDGRHARVPAPRRADRRGAGLDRRDAEGQADPHDRGRDAARRARADRVAARSSGWSRTSSSAARTAATASSSSTSRRTSRPSDSPSAAARSTAATRS